MQIPVTYVITVQQGFEQKLFFINSVHTSFAFQQTYKHNNSCFNFIFCTNKNSKLLTPLKSMFLQYRHSSVKGKWNVLERPLITNIIYNYITAFLQSILPERTS